MSQNILIASVRLLLRRAVRCRGRWSLATRAATVHALCAVFLTAGGSRCLMAQTVVGSDQQPTSATASHPSNFVRAIISDERRIFTVPARIRRRDAKWLLPLAGTFAYLVASDQRNMSERIHLNQLSQDRALRLSNASTAAIASIPLFLYWRGWHEGDDYARDTGLLSGRAAVDGLLAAGLLRAITSRQRPDQGDGGGLFLRSHDISSSFPSMHSTVAWALASVVAERYPGWLTQTGVYGLAAAVSIGRVAGREHFPSDVVAGSALGWLIGRYVSHSGAPTGARYAASPTAAGSSDESRETGPASPGSSYIPMDSWVYIALDRLAAFGLIPSQVSGVRPWTRAECSRQMLEAAASLKSNGQAFAGIADDAAGILGSLHRELDEGGSGTASVVLESIYVRTGMIAGLVLNDSFHFGQTWRNDFGRPFGRGLNSYEGFSARAESGRFFSFVQAEHQHAKGAEAYSPAVRKTISQMDAIPLQEAAGTDSTDRFRSIEAYAGVRIANLEFSAGKQSLWWGPTNDGPLSFSSNAEPTKNFRISTVHGFRMPSILRYLGEIRGEFVMGKLGGQKYAWRPWFNAQKVSFKLTDNLEVGFTRWSIFWGVGHPITVGSFIRNFTSTNSPLGLTGVGRTDPGDRKGGFDFRYRVPGLRNWLTVYSDAYCDDDPSPLAAPRRAAINPGIYLSRVPGMAKLDFRVEAPSTMPMNGDHGGAFIYQNVDYLSGNTNYGNLLGNAVGRDGRALEAWTNYWFSARNRVEFGVRHLKIGTQFLPGGGTQTDATLKASLELRRNWQAEIVLQRERFLIPALDGARTNLTASVRLAWTPRLTLVEAKPGAGR